MRFRVGLVSRVFPKALIKVVRSLPFFRQILKEKPVCLTRHWQDLKLPIVSMRFSIRKIAVRNKTRETKTKQVPFLNEGSKNFAHLMFQLRSFERQRKVQIY